MILSLSCFNYVLSQVLTSAKLIQIHVREKCVNLLDIQGIWELGFLGFFCLSHPSLVGIGSDLVSDSFKLLFGAKISNQEIVLFTLSKV